MGFRMSEHPTEHHTTVHELSTINCLIYYAPRSADMLGIYTPMNTAIGTSTSQEFLKLTDMLVHFQTLIQYALLKKCSFQIYNVTS